MIDRYTTQEKIIIKIFMSDVSVYNTPPTLGLIFEEKNAYYTRKITVRELQINSSEPCFVHIRPFSPDLIQC